MSAPVKQAISDHLCTETDPDWAHPDKWLVDEDWRTGFEFAGGVR